MTQDVIENGSLFGACFGIMYDFTFFFEIKFRRISLKCLTLARR